MCFIDVRIDINHLLTNEKNVIDKTMHNYFLWIGGCHDLNAERKRERESATLSDHV